MKAKYLSHLILIPILIYVALVIIVGSYAPADILYRFTGTSIKIDSAVVVKSFYKYAYDDDLLLMWSDSKEREDLKWDSTWGYSLRINGVNNLSSPIIIDSIIISDTKSNNPLFNIRTTGRSIASKNPFNILIDIKRGMLYPIAFYEHHDKIIDSSAEYRFNKQLIAVSIFSSFGEQKILPTKYITRTSW